MRFYSIVLIIFLCTKVSLSISSIKDKPLTVSYDSSSQIEETAPPWLNLNIGKLDSLFGPHWDIKGRLYFHLSQGAQFNWAKGGENLFSSLIKSKISGRFTKGKQLWNNQLTWNYGFLFVSNPHKRTVDYRTGEDLFELNSSYGYQAAPKLYYNALFNFKSQFFPGYKYPNDSIKVSNFLSPAYIIFSLGMNFEPHDRFSLMLSPLTSKSTLVIKQGKDPKKVDETKYGLKEGERIYKEVGAYLKLKYTFNISKDIVAENNLNLFSNYNYKPENIDVELKSNFNFIINKNIKAILSLHFIYDDDAQIPINEYINGTYTLIGYTKGLQFEEKIMLGIGIDF